MLLINSSWFSRVYPALSCRCYQIAARLGSAVWEWKESGERAGKRRGVAEVREVWMSGVQEWGERIGGAELKMGFEVENARCDECNCEMCGLVDWCEFLYKGEC